MLSGILGKQVKGGNIKVETCISQVPQKMQLLGFTQGPVVLGGVDKITRRELALKRCDVRLLVAGCARRLVHVSSPL